MSTKKTIDEKELATWTEGAQIIKTQYEDGVLALELSNGNILICYTQVIAQGVKI